MSIEGQRLDPERYALIPRTLSFLINETDILLIRNAEQKGAWAGKLNGIGGHIERGEDPLSSAVREIDEETGLAIEDLRLCGVVSIDLEPEIGIGLFVFAGRAQRREIRSGPEGEPAWFDRAELRALPLVEDLRVLIPAVLEAFQNQRVFCAAYRYREDGSLNVEFAS